MTNYPAAIRGCDTLGKTVKDHYDLLSSFTTTFVNPRGTATAFFRDPPRRSPLFLSHLISRYLVPFKAR
jgi:hypothetical protein